MYYFFIKLCVTICNKILNIVLQMYYYLSTMNKQKSKAVLLKRKEWLRQ
jgi:hypothetical protein